MSDFSPGIVWFIMAETLGIWFWPVLALAAVLLLLVIAGFTRLRRARRSAGRPLVAALLATLAVALVAAWFVPAWTRAGAGSLAAPVDYVFTFLVALIPGGIVGALVFFTAASHCARRGRTA
ncbi:MAG: DUF5368 family protein [Gemmobacter sp.]